MLVHNPTITGSLVVSGSITSTEGISGNVPYSNLTGIPSGIISSSAQIDLVFNLDGVVSSSNQIASDISGSVTSLSSSIATRFDGLTSDYTELTNIPQGIVSSSTQLASDISGSFTVASSSLASSISNIIDGTTLVSSASYAISSSHEITFELSSSHAEVADEVPYTGITGKPTLVSGSNQLASDISGSTTALSASIATRFDGLTSDYTELTNIPAGIISSSAQFNALSNTSASYALTASYAENAGGGARFPYSGSAVITGSLLVTEGVSANSFTETSALRYKEEVTDLESSDSIYKLRPVRFSWKQNHTPDIGLIAEEVKNVIPELVGIDKSGQVEGIKYSKLTSLLIKAVQDQQNQINELKKEIAVLKKS